MDKLLKLVGRLQQMTRKNARRAQAGMTLVEIMVVIASIGVLMAAVGVAVIPQLGKAQAKTACSDIKNIKSALDLYRTQKGRYPDTSAGLKALVERVSER